MLKNQLFIFRCKSISYRNPKTQNKNIFFRIKIHFKTNHKTQNKILFFRNIKPESNSIFQTPNPNLNQTQIFSFGPLLVSGGDGWDLKIWKVMVAARGGGLWCYQCLVVEKPWRFDNGERVLVIKENIYFTKIKEK